MTCGARALILPDALRHNLAVIRRRAPGCRVMAAVKGNAYGHGLVLAARELESADSLAVARLSEAASLRRAGISSAIVLLAGPMDDGELNEAARLDLEIVVHSPAQLPLLENAAPQSLVVWLKLDTGMHRLGFPADESAGLIARLRTIDAIRELRLMTHLATADEPGQPQTAVQVAAFRDICTGFDGAVSIANSPALFAVEGANEDRSFWGHRGDTWVRPGLALYGISPFTEGYGADLGLKAVMQFETRLVDVKAIRAGERVGYGGRWTATQDTCIGIIAAGYGDGYTRFLPSGTPVLINERRVPLAGVVSMDLAAVDLGPAARDKVGDRVVLWGRSLPVEDIARAAGTIPYQLVTGVLHREALQSG